MTSSIADGSSTGRPIRFATNFEQSTWQAFWLTAVEGQDPRTAAQASGISVGAVYIARSRVMARLKSIIEQVEGESVS